MFENASLVVRELIIKLAGSAIEAQLQRMEWCEDDVALSMARSAVDGHIEALVEYEYAAPPQAVVLTYIDKAVHHGEKQNQ